MPSHYDVVFPYVFSFTFNIATNSISNIYWKSKIAYIQVWNTPKFLWRNISFSNNQILKEEYFGITSWNFQNNWKAMKIFKNDLNHTGVKLKNHKTPCHGIIHWKVKSLNKKWKNQFLSYKKYRFSAWSIHEALYQIDFKVLLLSVNFRPIEKHLISK